MKKKLKYDLNRQLISIGILICGIIFIALGILLPKVLTPIYENNIYKYLKQPLELIDYEIGDDEIGSDVAYLYITSQKEVISSENFSKVIDVEPTEILSKIDNDFGKFQYKGQTYYYNTSYNKFVTKISLTDDSYITDMRKDILYTIFPILLITLLIISGLLLLWSRKLVKKIGSFFFSIFSIMKKLLIPCCLVLLAGCVDKDYDKEIDMNVTIAENGMR